MCRKLCGLLFACILLLCGCSGEQSPPEVGVAVHIGESSIPKDEYQYCYVQQVYSFALELGDQMTSDFGFNIDTPLSDQQFMDDQSWDDFFQEQVLETLQDEIILSLEAERRRLSLTQAEIDGIYDWMYELYDQEDLDATLGRIYGPIVTQDTLLRVMSRRQLAVNCQALLLDELGDRAAYEEYLKGERRLHPVQKTDVLVLFDWA